MPIAVERPTTKNAVYLPKLFIGNFYPVRDQSLNINLKFLSADSQPTMGRKKAKKMQLKYSRNSKIGLNLWLYAKHHGSGGYNSVRKTSFKVLVQQTSFSVFKKLLDGTDYQSNTNIRR